MFGSEKRAKYKANQQDRWGIHAASSRSMTNKRQNQKYNAATDSYKRTREHINRTMDAEVAGGADRNAVRKAHEPDMQQAHAAWHDTLTSIGQHNRNLNEAQFGGY